MGKRERKSNRLKDFDYSQPGYYHVVIVSMNRICLFGEIDRGVMVQNEAGKMIENTWQDIGKKYSEVILDKYVIMPNHIHGIIQIHSITHNYLIKEIDEKPNLKDVRPTLSRIIHGLKLFQPANISKELEVLVGIHLKERYGKEVFMIVSFGMGMNWMQFEPILFKTQYSGNWIRRTHFQILRVVRLILDPKIIGGMMM